MYAGPLIVASATPWGHGALALVRLSGDGLDRVIGPGGRPPPRLRPGRTRRGGTGGVATCGLDGARGDDGAGPEGYRAVPGVDE